LSRGQKIERLGGSRPSRRPDDLAGSDREEVADDDCLDRRRLEPAVDVALDVTRRPPEEGGELALGAAWA
jgi:hypothetical protein